MSVHRRDCSNINELDFEEGRMIDVSWTTGETSYYNVEVQIVADDRGGLIAEITQLLYSLNLSITALNARTSKNSTAMINVGMGISDLNQLTAIINKMKGIKGVHDVYRLNN